MNIAMVSPGKANKQSPAAAAGGTTFFRPLPKLSSQSAPSYFFQPSPITGIQRKCAACGEKEKIQMKNLPDSNGNAIAPTIVENAFHSGGNPLDPATRNFMESRFGYNFKNVLVHHGTEAQESAAAIDALAYTHGSHVVFGYGQYHPHTNEGRQLIAHELAHVVQQGETVRRKEKPPADKTAAGSPITFTCNPVECTHDEYMARAKKNGYNAGDSFGITVLDPAAVTTPVIALNAEKKLLPTTASAAIQSSFIGARQIFKDDNGQLPANRDFVCDDLTIHFLITTDGAAKIKEGEMEHCADFKQAFDLTFSKYATAVNTIAGKGKPFKDQPAAEAAVEKITQVPYNKWAEKFNCLADKTRLRDTRLYHKPMTIAARMYPTERKCRFPVMDIAGKHFPKIGTFSSKDLIKDCE